MNGGKVGKKIGKGKKGELVNKDMARKENRRESKLRE